jgi:two-component system competent response regulator ComA
MVSRGLTNAAIACVLGRTSRTVELHLAHIYEKLGVGSRTEAAVMALRHGYLLSESHIPD